MPREFYWQKTAVCGLGCVYYEHHADGTEECHKVGYFLHPDWCAVAEDCETFETAEQKADRERTEEVRRKIARQAQKRAKDNT